MRSKILPDEPEFVIMNKPLAILFAVLFGPFVWFYTKRVYPSRVLFFLYTVCLFILFLIFMPKVERQFINKIMWSIFYLFPLVDTLLLKSSRQIKSFTDYTREYRAEKQQKKTK